MNQFLIYKEYLNLLKTYCDCWGLEVNSDKTKRIVFRKRGRKKPEDQWTYDGKIVEIVDDFNYLGVLLNYNGSFNRHQQLI